MSFSRVEQYRRWFEYEKDSHHRVLASLQSVSPDQRQSASFQKALDIMGHIVAARRMWLFRFGGTADRPASLFPTGTSLDELPGDLDAMERAWDDYLPRLTEDDLTRAFEYQSVDGGWFRSVVEDIFAQLFGHSWYHRGQIASLVKSAGGEPAATDFVLWCRESISPPG
jgi:uncharacterized damage-inducible protein DinB